MSRHVPEIMSHYYASGLDDLTPRQQVAFDRWLALHDAQVVERVTIEARETCYSDECGEPCQSWQRMWKAERDEYKARAETAGRRLGEARAEIARLKSRRWADEFGA